MAVTVGELVQSENTSNLTAILKHVGIADSLKLNLFLFQIAILYELEEWYA